MRNLALCGMCGARRATVKPSNQFVPVTRPLSFTGERERCSILVQGGDALAWPHSCIVSRQTSGVLLSCDEMEAVILISFTQ